MAADERFDDVDEIRLPAKLFARSIGIAFDVGEYAKLSSIGLRMFGMLC